MKVREIFPLVVMLTLLLGGSSSFAQEYEDVVYLKNGEIRRGMIIEETPFVLLKIQTKDGNVFVFSYDEIKKKTKEKPLHPRPVFNDPYSMTNPRSKVKNPGAAMALAAAPGFFGLCGGGQVYNEQVGKGVFYFASGFISAAWMLNEISQENSYYEESNPQFPAVIFLATYFVSIADAYRSAKDFNNRLQGVIFNADPSSSKILFGATSIGEKSLGVRAIVRF